MLEATHLVRSYETGRRRLLRRRARFNAVDGVSLAVAPGETLGIVGESGCGKSTLAMLLTGLLRPDAGTLRLEGRDVSGLDDAGWRPLRTRVQLVFQDAAGALDPRLPVGAQVAEGLRIHRRDPTGAEAALAAVGLGGMAGRHPHELSGGQLQRVVIARALALDPAVLVLDEPVAALDVSIQAQILNLLVRLQAERGLAYVFVSHDIGVVRHIADRIAVMYLGRIVEEGPGVVDTPQHPYAQALVGAMPVPDPTRRSRRLLQGEPPNPARAPSGCRFHPRCPLAEPRCAAAAPALTPLGPGCVACHVVTDPAREAA